MKFTYEDKTKNIPISYNEINEMLYFINNLIKFK